MEPTEKEKQLGEAQTEAIKQARKDAGGSLHWPELTAVLVRVLMDHREVVPLTPEMVYQAYPRRVAGKLAVKKIIQAEVDLVKDGKRPLEALPFLMERTQAFAAAVKRWPVDEQKRFCPHPATWFGQARYLDDPTTWERGTKAKAKGPANYSKI